METDKVYNKDSELIFEGTTEETVQWILRGITDAVYLRNGKTGHLQSVSEYLSVYV